MDIPNPYKGNYLLLAIFPLALIAISLFLVLVTPGIVKGVDFKGGILITLHSEGPVDAALLSSQLKAEGFQVTDIKTVSNPASSITEIELERSAKLEEADRIKSNFYKPYQDLTRLESSLLFTNDSRTISDYNAAKVKLDEIAGEMFTLAGSGKTASGFNTTVQLRNAVTEDWRMLSDSESALLRSSLSRNVKYESVSFDEVTSSLSEKFFDSAISIAIWSTILVSIVVFFIFRTPVPSAAVLIGALCDVIIALGAMAFFQIPLTLASFAALLMLVGFSLDTDVLLTMRVVKRKEGLAADRAYEAMKTGLTMSLAVFLAFSALFVLASLTNLRIYYEISSVALAGLVGDMFATWGINAVIILHYMQEEEKKGGVRPVKPLASMIFRQ